tara:strand:+ start:2394 stop:4043 length:1650 start_codon:yes stop_codon:yes gene_type:complete
MKSGLYTKLRIWSGAVLYIFVCLHLFNHSLGLISVESMEIARVYFINFWRHPVGTLLLYSSLSLHLILVLISLAKRKSLKMPFSEAVQTIFALIFPFGLILHILGTRGAHEIFGFNDNYPNELYTLWVESIELGIGNSILIILVWVHGTLGLYFWLRFRPWFSKTVAWIFSVIIVLPVIAFLGFVNGGRQIQSQFEAGTYIPPVITKEAVETIYGYLYLAWMIYISLIALVILYRIFTWIYNKRKKLVRVTYPNGRIIAVELGTTVLDASRKASIPHASVCGGKGRCSTCRIRVSVGKEFLPNPSIEESKVLKRVSANKHIRLACQLTPTHDLTVTPLLPPDSSTSLARGQPLYRDGAEQEIAILFTDIRSFTTIAEKKLPYDVVFMLNQYFRTMGQAIESSGGQIDKFIGDGVMALFGLDKTPKEACFSALEAAKFMAEGLEELNNHLKADLEEPLMIRIGIHIGNVIVGDMGYAQAKSITAIGDAVNTASRLESLNKNFNSQLLVSKKVIDIAEIDMKKFKQENVKIPGRTQPLSVCIINNASLLSL